MATTLTRAAAPVSDYAPRHAKPEAPAPHRPPAAVAVGIVAALTALLSVMFVAFGLPAVKSAPHDVPIGVAAPAEMSRQISTQLAAAAPGAFVVTTFADDGALRAAILNRDVYGGLSFGPGGATLYTATGAGPAVAQLLSGAATGMAQQTGTPLHTEDLAPPMADDPRGAGLAASALPLTLAGMLPAIILLTVFKREVWLRLVAMVVFAPIAAAAIAALLYYVFGSIDTNIIAVTAGLTLGILAMGMAILGLGALFGKAGIAIGAVIAMFVGNPLSALTSAPELLPAGWGALGQLLPQGANATLLRSTAFFDGAGASHAVVVLSCWAVAGLVLVLIAALRRRA